MESTVILKNKPSAQCVAYIDARDVMERLDQVVGVENWQDDYKFIEDGKTRTETISISNGWYWYHVIMNGMEWTQVQRKSDRG